MTKLLTKCAILLGGLYATGFALWNLWHTAVFVYESEVVPGIVEDMTEKHNMGMLEMLRHGNLPWEGDIAYHPIVRYDFAGYSRLDSTLPDLDNKEYSNHQQVEIIINPQQPHQRHLNRAKFLWLGDILLLVLGALLLLISRHLLKRRKKKARAAAPAAHKPERPAPAAEAAPAPRPAPAPKQAPKPAPPAKQPKPEAAEPEFRLEPEEAPPAPKRRRKTSSSSSSSRSKKTASDPDKPKRTRAKKTAAAGDAAPKTPAKRRRKKQDSAAAAD